MLAGRAFLIFCGGSACLLLAEGGLEAQDLRSLHVKAQRMRSSSILNLKFNRPKAELNFVTADVHDNWVLSHMGLDVCWGQVLSIFCTLELKFHGRAHEMFGRTGRERDVWQPFRNPSQAPHAVQTNNPRTPKP